VYGVSEHFCYQPVSVFLLALLLRPEYLFGALFVLEEEE